MEAEGMQKETGKRAKKYFAMKLIRPRATQAVMYCTAAAAAFYLAINGGDKYDLALAGVMGIFALGYTVYQASRLSKTYYRIGSGSLTVSKPEWKRSLSWDDIDYALYDANSRSIELILKDGDGVLLDEYDDLKILTQGLDMRGVRLEYRKMK